MFIKFYFEGTSKRKRDFKNKQQILDALRTDASGPAKQDTFNLIL